MQAAISFITGSVRKKSNAPSWGAPPVSTQTPPPLKLLLLLQLSSTRDRVIALQSRQSDIVRSYSGVLPREWYSSTVERCRAERVMYSSTVELCRTESDMCLFYWKVVRNEFIIYRISSRLRRYEYRTFWYRDEGIFSIYRAALLTSHNMSHSYYASFSAPKRLKF